MCIYLMTANIHAQYLYVWRKGVAGGGSRPHYETRGAVRHQPELCVDKAALGRVETPKKNIKINWYNTTPL
jgi:hypothetical protein